MFSDRGGRGGAVRASCNVWIGQSSARRAARRCRQKLHAFFVAIEDQGSVHGLAWESGNCANDDNIFCMEFGAESVGLLRESSKIEEFSDTCGGFADYPRRGRPFLGSPSVAKQSLGPAIIHENQIIIIK